MQPLGNSWHNSDLKVQLNPFEPDHGDASLPAAVTPAPGIGLDPELKRSPPDMSILMILAPHNFWMTIGEPCAQDCWILPGVFSHFEVLSLPLSVPLISLSYLVCTGHNTPPRPTIFGYVIVGSMPDIT